MKLYLLDNRAGQASVLGELALLDYANKCLLGAEDCLRKDIGIDTEITDKIEAITVLEFLGYDVNEFKPDKSTCMEFD